MNLFFWIFRVSSSAIGGLIISLLVTFVAWNVQIEHRAFHCSDDVGFGFFWENMEIHERAGDTLSPNWTWDSLRSAKAGYKVAFFSVWFATTAVMTMTILRRSIREKHAHPA